MLLNRRNNASLAKIGVIGVLVTFIIAIIIIGGFEVSDKDAERILTSQGFTNVETNGYSWFGCSKDQRWRKKFVATGPTGIKVEGVICQSVFGGTSVRIY